MAAAEVSVSINNLAPTDGTRLTPIWVGFHNGQFDTFEKGQRASSGLERLAEDGNNAVLSQDSMPADSDKLTAQWGLPQLLRVLRLVKPLPLIRP